MVHYKSIKVTINILGLAKVIINGLIKYHNFLGLIITNQRLLFISEFWSLLCYFLSIKQKLSIAFHFQIDGQIEK